MPCLSKFSCEACLSARCKFIEYFDGGTLCDESKPVSLGRRIVRVVTEGHESWCSLYSTLDPDDNKYLYIGK